MKTRDKLILYVLIAVFLSCSTKKTSNRLSKQIEFCDSVAIIETIKNWHDSNWDMFEDYSKMYNTTNKDVEYSIVAAFYNSTKNKLVVWVGEKTKNVTTKEKYSINPRNNRMAPLGNDSVYSISCILALRDSANKLLIYPWGNRQVPFSSLLDDAIFEMEQYYFNNIRTDKVTIVIQSGTQKGKIVDTAYKYSLLDKEFWDGSPIWQKDTVGTKGLYRFQVQVYRPFSNKCNYCGEQIVSPYVPISCDSIETKNSGCTAR